MSLHSRLRRQFPSLTPPFAGDSEERLLSTMRDSIKPPEETKWLKTPEMVDPNTGINLRAAEGIANEESSKPLPRIHLGVSTKGLQGVERDLARVQAAREFDREGLGFKITPEGVDMKPPDPHIDWKDRLKAGGKAAIISIANIRKANPNASVAEMLAGGATGGGIGLASPETGNAMFRRAQIEDMEGQLAPQLAREGAVAKIETERMKPVLEAEKVRRDEEYRRAQLEIQRDLEQGRTTRAEAERQLRELQLREQERHNREQERLNQGKIDKPEKDTSFTNSQIEQNISEAAGEKRKIADALANTAEWIEETDAYGEKHKKPNPIHQSLKARERELDDQIRRWRADIKPPTLSRRDPSVQAYADKFFKGDVAAAEAAIKKQRG